MPNGDPAFDREALDRFFEPFKATLEAFADANNLRIEKYYHDAPAWNLCFNHPNGGGAQIEVVRKKDRTAAIKTWWWQDDHASFSRSLKWGEERPCPEAREGLRRALTQALEEILSWDGRDWSKVVTGFERTWGRHSRAEFERMRPDWPRPTRAERTLDQLPSGPRSLSPDCSADLDDGRTTPRRGKDEP